MNEQNCLSPIETNAAANQTAAGSFVTDAFAAYLSAIRPVFLTAIETICLGLVLFSAGAARAETLEPEAAQSSLPIVRVADVSGDFDKDARTVGVPAEISEDSEKTSEDSEPFVPLLLSADELETETPAATEREIGVRELEGPAIAEATEAHLAEAEAEEVLDAGEVVEISEVSEARADRESDPEGAIAPLAASPEVFSEASPEAFDMRFQPVPGEIAPPENLSLQPTLDISEPTPIEISDIEAPETDAGALAIEALSARDSERVTVFHVEKDSERGSERNAKNTERTEGPGAIAASPLDANPDNIAAPEELAQVPVPSQEEEPQVLVAELVVEGVEGELQLLVYDTISTRPGRTTTRSGLQEDINAIFATGFFSNVRALPEDTPLGVRVTFVVQPNPVLTGVRLDGGQVLPPEVLEETFSPLYGNTLNLREFQEGVQRVNQWYQDNGYPLAQVIDATDPDEGGVVSLIVAEGEVESIELIFLDEEGNTEDEEGNLIEGRTKRFVVLREMQLQAGDIFNRNEIEGDLERIFRLGLFEDVRPELQPSENDPRKVNVVLSLIERSTGSVAAGGGVSSASGLFGTVSYQEQNLFGRNQRLGAEVQLGIRGLLFDVSFTDPWIKGDPHRTSFTANVFSRRSISLIFDDGETEVELPNGDRPRIQRIGSGFSISRPFSRNPLERSEWRGSLGVQYERVSTRDSDGDVVAVDELGNQLTFSDDGRDDLYTVQFGAVRDRRDSALKPTSGSLLRLGTEQSIPFGSGNILMNRLRGSYSFYRPVNFISFGDGPSVVAINFQAGTVLGDLPPYEAFPLGGSNSVRGYGEADLGAGRSFVQATAEYRFPVITQVIDGAIFVDAGTDLGTGDNVPGEPAEVRDKPGSGFGYGLGVRVQSPLGPIRIDFAFNDEGDSRLHFGIGERF